MPVESAMSTRCGWLASVPGALLSDSAFCRSAGGSGVGVPICPIATVFSPRMKMHDRRNAVRIRDVPATLRTPMQSFIPMPLLFILLGGANFRGLNLQFFVQCAELLFHVFQFLVEF